jgi:hypothetical protein
MNHHHSWNRKYHIPTRVAWLTEITDDRAARLERTLLDAIRRAVASATSEDAAITAGTRQDDGPLRELYASERFRPERGTYAVPTYDNGGEAIEIPVEVAVTFEEEAIYASPDQVIEHTPQFQRATVMTLPGNRYVFVSSHRYATTLDIGRAYAWGRTLFGASAWVIVAKPDKHGELVYNVAALDKPITEADLGIEPVAAPETEMRPVGFFRGRILEKLADDYSVVAVGFKGGGFATPTPEAYATFVSGVRETREAGTAAVDPGIARHAVFGAIDDLLARGGSDNLERAADLLSELNATAFALVDWQTRAQYLKVLADAWTEEPEETAIVELLKAMGSRSELDAALGLLHQQDVFDKLFADLDSQIWSLLIEIGRKLGEPKPITFEFILTLLQDAGLLPRSLEELLLRITIGPTGPAITPDLIADLEEAARGFVRFLGGTLESIVTLISHPDKLIEGAAQLARLALMVQLAHLGYPHALRYLANVVRLMSQQVVLGLRGAEVLALNEEIIRRIRWAVLWEIASWFIGVGEVNAILSSAGVGKRLAALGRLLRVLRSLGRAAESEEAISKIAHIAVLLRRAGTAAHEDEVLRLLAHLPEEDVLRLGRHLEPIDVQAFEDLAAISTRHPELGAAIQHVRERCEALALLQRRTGVLNDTLVVGFQRLAQRSGFTNSELLSLIDNIPSDHAELFMRAVREMPVSAFGSGIGARRYGFFYRLANNPRSIRFMLDTGYDTFSALYRHAGYDFARFEEYLQAIEDLAQRMPAAKRAVEYRRLLDRLAAGEPTAVAELRTAANTRRAAAGTPLIRSFTAVELDEIVRTTPDIRDIRRLSEQMDNSTAGSLFERWVHSHVFGRRPGTQRIRLRVRSAENPHMDQLWQDRVSDVYLESDGTVWDAKIYRTSGEIDAFQLDDYRKMEEAGFVIDGAGVRRNVSSINYIFSDRAAAEANRSLIHVQAGGEAWFVDDRGILKHLD